MKVTLLGCGTSVGVPALGHAGWGACNPADPRNRRQRCAVLVQTEETTVLVDAGPDIRNQLMSHELKKIDGVLITHTHSDHIAGLDDLRAFYWPERNDLLIHTLPQHAQDIETRFPYLFRNQPNSPTYFVPPMKTVPIAAIRASPSAICRSRYSIRTTAIWILSGFCLMTVLLTPPMWSVWKMPFLTGSLAFHSGL